MRNHPHHPNQLPRTKWTSAEGAFAYRHWEVEVLRVKRDTVELRATLERSHALEIPWRELRNRDIWEPGWLPT